MLKHVQTATQMQLTKSIQKYSKRKSSLDLCATFFLPRLSDRKSHSLGEITESHGDEQLPIQTLGVPGRLFWESLGSPRLRVKKTPPNGLNPTVFLICLIVFVSKIPMSVGECAKFAK